MICVERRTQEKFLSSRWELNPRHSRHKSDALTGREKKKLENTAPNNTLRHLLSGVSMPSNQKTTSTIICIIHGILHSTDIHASLGTKIEECVDKCGLVLLCT